MNALNLFSALSKVQKLKLQAVSHQSQKMDWSGAAIGEVLVSKIGEDVLIFKESGEWISPELPRVTFSNVYRWRLKDEGEVIELSHFRFDAENPVQLIDFISAENERMISKDAHICRADRYEASVYIEEEKICLSWNISGPNKNQRVECVYQ
jgi:hypothetical protein